MKVYIILLVLLLILLLQGCMSAVITGSAAVAVKTIVDPRSIRTQIDDSLLKAYIVNSLILDHQIRKNTRIVSTVYKGKVLLTGQTQSIRLSKYVEQIISNIDGVKKIYNEIRQNKPITFKNYLIDSWLTFKIYSYLSISSTLKLSNMKIVTENNEVFLLGIVTHTEGKIAKEIISKIDGVKKVITIFSYL